MTVTLTLPVAIGIIVMSMLWGAVIGAAVMLDVMWDRRPRQPGLPLARLADPAPLPWELSPFPGEHGFSRSEWAADMESTLSAADDFIALYPDRSST